MGSLRRFDLQQAALQLGLDLRHVDRHRHVEAAVDLVATELRPADPLVLVLVFVVLVRVRLVHGLDDQLPRRGGNAYFILFEAGQRHLQFELVIFLDQLGELARLAGKPVTWTALLGGMFGPEGHRGILEQCGKLQAEGAEVWPQVSCRPLMTEYQLKAPFPFQSLDLFEPVSAADAEGKKRLYGEPAFRAGFREQGDRGVLSGGWEHTVVSDVPGRPELAERNLAELAAERGVHPADLVLDLSLATDLEARFRVAVANTDEAIVGELLSAPGAVLGLSDAGAHASQLCDACAPTHLLGHWVREVGVLSVEEGVRKLTSEPARLFGLHDRGRLAPGLAGDVTVFDPDTVGCSPLRRVYDLPAGADRLVSDAAGIRAVVVHGTVLREDGRDRVDPDGPLPGRVLRGGRLAP